MKSHRDAILHHRERGSLRSLHTACPATQFSGIFVEGDQIQTTVNMPWVRVVVRHTLIWALVAAAIVGVISALTGHFDSVTWNAFGTIALFAFFALVSWYDADVSAKRSTWFGVASAVTSVFLLIYGLLKIWLPSNDYDLRWFAMFAVIRILLLHIHLLLTIYSKFAGRVMNAIARVTGVLAVALAVLLAIPVLDESPDLGEGYWRALATVAILDALGTILVPLVHALLYRGSQKPGVWHPVPPVVSSRDSQLSYRPAPPVQRNAGPSVDQSAVTDASSTQVTEAVASSELPGRTPPAPGLPMPVSAESYAASDAEVPVLRLAWPRYENGAPVPRDSHGNPDFTGVKGF